MNVHEFTQLLQHPENVLTASQTNGLEEVIAEYPYFQAARAVHLKGLKRLNSFKYNNALKITAAYTTDRNVLFDFITSTPFIQQAHTVSESKEDTPVPALANEEVPSSTKYSTAIQENKAKVSGPAYSSVADTLLDPTLFIAKNNDPTVDTPTNDLEIGQPIPFTRGEKYSFSEWLQLTSKKTITRDDTPSRVERRSDNFILEEAVLKKKKFELIDKFISGNPKITPKDQPSEKIDVSAHETFDKNELMTETLARVYLEQKKYKKALQAYKILSLKYPEKSSFFADRIKMIEKIQQDNSQ